MSENKTGFVIVTFILVCVFVCVRSRDIRYTARYSLNGFGRNYSTVDNKIILCGLFQRLSVKIDFLNKIQLSY